MINNNNKSHNKISIDNILFCKGKFYLGIPAEETEHQQLLVENNHKNYKYDNLCLSKLLYDIINIPDKPIEMCSFLILDSSKVREKENQFPKITHILDKCLNYNNYKIKIIKKK